MQYLKFTLMLCLTATFLLSCDDDEDPVSRVLEAETVTNLAADPTQMPDGSPAEKTNQFTLFSFKENAVIPNSDSATTRWDIGFRSTTIIVNGGASGPGSTEAQLVSGIFDELTEAPESGYKTDTEAEYAIKGTDGWYSYTGHTGTPPSAIIAVPGKTIMLKTSDGKYAKMEILSYYYGNPNTTTDDFADLSKRPPSRYYTFRFIYQPDGSSNLSSTTASDN